MRLVSRPSTTPSVSTSRVLPSPGTPTSSTWPPAEQRDQGLIDDLLLAEDDPSDRRPDRADAGAERLHCVQDGMIRRGL